MRIALIDLGSNSARMFILEYSAENGFEYILRRRIMTKLSEGMTESGFLQTEAAERTIGVLANFAAEAHRNGASVLAVATAAVRKAKNADEFCEAVSDIGIKLNVISGETEAFFDFKGTMDGLPDISDCIITDTGGGSTELILVRERRQIRKISIPVGAVSLYEDFGSDYAAAERMIEEVLDKSDFLSEADGVPIVGIGGSICAAARLDMTMKRGRQDYDINAYEITAEGLVRLIEELAAKTPEEREKIGIERGRATTICHGLLPTEVIMRKISSPRLVVCRYGLREGILAEMSRGNTEEYIKNPQSFIEKYVKIQ